MYQYIILDSASSVVYRSAHIYHTAEEANDCGNYDLTINSVMYPDCTVDVPSLINDLD